MHISATTQLAFLPCKCVSTALAFYQSSEKVSRIYHGVAPFQFLLHQCVGLPVDDRLMRIAVKILRHFAVIFHFHLADRVRSEGLLPENIPGVDLVDNVISHGCFLKIVPLNRMDSCGSQLVGDLLVGITLQEQPEHISDALRFFGDDNIPLQLFVILVAENVLVCSTDQAFLKAFSDTPFAVIGNGA